MTKKKTNRIPVVVFTDKRGVFFGWADLAAFDGDGWRRELVLTDARMAVYWSADAKGVLGLAATGPTTACRITPAVAELTLVDLHGATRCTDAAVKEWEAAPWG